MGAEAKAVNLRQGQIERGRGLSGGLTRLDPLDEGRDFLLRLGELRRRSLACSAVGPIETANHERDPLPADVELGSHLGQGEPWMLEKMPAQTRAE